MAFTDLAVLQSELELKRRRELHRQNSQKAAVAATNAETRQRNSPRNTGNPGASSSGVTGSEQSRNYVGDGQENNFNSLPWEEIIPRRVGGVPVLPPEHLQQPVGQGAGASKENSRSKSQDTRKDKRSSLFSGAGWFNPGHVWREAEPDVRGLGGNSVKQQGHWLLKESSSLLIHEL